MDLGYIKLVQGMYCSTMIRARAVSGTNNSVSLRVGIHQGSTLSSYQFIMSMGELQTRIGKMPPQCMVLARDCPTLVTNAELKAHQEKLIS